MKTDLIKEVAFLLNHCFKFMNKEKPSGNIALNETYNIHYRLVETANYYPNIELDFKDRHTVLHIINAIDRQKDYKSIIYDDALLLNGFYRINEIIYKSYEHHEITTFEFKDNKDDIELELFNANLLHDSLFASKIELSYCIPEIMGPRDEFKFLYIFTLSIEELQNLVQALKDFINANVEVKLENT